MTHMQRRQFLLGATALGVVPMLGTIAASPARAAALPVLADLDVLGEPGRWNSYSREREPSCDVVQAVEFTLSPTTYGSGANMIVVADTVFVEGVVRAPSRDLTIAARKVVFRDGAQIDTSGEAGVDRSDTAPQGVTPGDKGGDGQKGASGAPGGNVSIFASQVQGVMNIVANGGAGAQGQQGGAGAQGATGLQGSPASSKNDAGKGAPGGRGGTAGSGGQGGDGGVAGKIFCILSASPQTDPQFSALGGRGGDPGVPGRVGAPGLGGNPGQPCYKQRVPKSPENPAPRWEEYCGPQASQGDSGPAGNPAPQVNGRGIDQPPVAPEVQIGDMAKIYARFPITALTMSLYRCELDILNGTTDEIQDRLGWISACAAADGSGNSFYEERKKRLSADEVGQPSKDELQSIAGQSALMATNVSLGLDVFGHAPQYISDLNPDFLKSQSREWVDIATSVEDAYFSLLDKGQNAKVQADKLNAARSRVDDAIKAADLTIAKNETAINALGDNILALASQALDLQLQIERADQEFRRDVANKRGCEFKEMVSFVMGVITVAAAIYTGYGAFTGAMAAANAASSASSAGGVAGVINDLKILKKSFSDSGLVSAYKEMQQGYAEVKDALKQDSTKIVVSLEAFEAQLKDFMDLDSAKKYRDLMRQLAAVAQSKNAKQLELTQLVHQNDMERLQKISRKLESDRIGRMVASSQNPAMTECIVFLGRFLEQAKRSILRVTDLQRRGIGYLTCTPITLTYRTSRVAELNAIQSQLGDAWVRGLEEQTGSRQEMKSVLELTRASYPEVFKALEKENRAAFAIPVDHPAFNVAGTAFMRSSWVDLSIPKLPSTVKTIVCRLTHSGVSLVKNKSGQVFTYLHSSRGTNLVYDRKSGSEWESRVVQAGNLRGEDYYIQLSPFATWILEVDKVSGIDWKKTDQVVLKFTSSFIPADKFKSEQILLKGLNLQ